MRGGRGKKREREREREGQRTPTRRTWISVDDEADADEENEEDLGPGGRGGWVGETRDVRVLQCGELIDYRARAHPRTIVFAAGGMGEGRTTSERGKGHREAATRS